jgi:hypothetical protein
MCDDGDGMYYMGRDAGLDAAAEIIDDECARVLAAQDGKNDSVDLNLRMVAVLLPDLAAKIRALKS